MGWKDRVKEVKACQALKLDDAIVRARELEAQDKLSEAELTIRQADSDIYGAIAIADMYRDRLRRLAKGKDCQKAIDAFHLARSWACRTMPEPHTPEESDRNGSVCEEREVELMSILGFDPGAKQ